EGKGIRFTMSKEEADTIINADVRLSLTEFVEAPIALMRSDFVNRRQLILYVCYKKGAAHYEGEGKRSQQPGPDQARAFRRLDEIDAMFKLDERSGVFWEFLAIGQQVANSDDITRLIEKLRS